MREQNIGKMCNCKEKGVPFRNFRTCKNKISERCAVVRKRELCLEYERIKYPKNVQSCKEKGVMLRI